ncbi:MAG TPA: Spy/CpxP family protein refolding chaperone [Pyrinomonadaceae bacterium]|jgi:Spy/CpxP family protein refolding chaperone|nr:Spy/CpxP family protein refolding chaperone [Pyrinomonadaceae bacterium]
MKSIFTRAGLIAGLTALLSIAAFAQTTAPQSGNNGEGRGGRRGRMEEEGRMRGGGGRGQREGGGGGGRGMAERRALSRLNLSDAQRAQLREIEARYAENFKAQRMEMRQLIELREQGATLTPEQRQRAQQLRGELRDSAEKMQVELRAVLTSEQREQLKRMREEGEARRRQLRENRGTPDDNQ